MNKFHTYFFAISYMSLLLVFSCGKDDDSGNTSENCDKSFTPVVMMHGFLASGDTYANQKMRFEANGYCNSYVFAYDWNSLDQEADRAANLDLFINEVLQSTGASKVNLVGHSAGGGVGYGYLSDANRANKVEKYVHVGSSAQSGPAGPNEEIPTLNIWSLDDETVAGADIPNAENLTLSGADHYQVATGSDAFIAMYKFFNNDENPTEISFESGGITVKISGKVLTLGENQAIANADVRIFELDEFGNKTNSSPNHTVKTNSKGLWGPVNLSKGKNHLFEVNTNIAGDRKLFYYREAFKANNSLVYLRTFPPASSLAGILLSSIPENDDQGVVIVFTANQAVVAGRDNLIVDGETLSTHEFASADQTSIAFFLFDGNENQQTDLEAIGLFANFPFLAAVDIYFQTVTEESIECSFNSRKLYVKNRKSESEGISIAVFD